MQNDRPNLDLARQFTRDIGPATMIVGALIVIHAVVLQIIGSTFVELFVLPYGLMMILFGAAAFARTESMSGQGLRWVVVLVFAGGGAFSLWKWAGLIWGSRSEAMMGDPLMMGFYLMAGPALLVPAGLAAVRPGWVPLIAVPAIVSLAGGSVLGHGTYVLLEQFKTTELRSPLPDTMLLLGVVLTSAALILYSAQRGIALRTK